MNDTMIITLLGFIGSVIPIISVIIKLNTSITKLNTTMGVLNEQMKNSKDDRKEIHAQLNNHEIRIVKLEDKK